MYNGNNFGCGSSREYAPITLLSAGVSLVLADSFTRIFYRNATNLALPLIVCPGISKKVSEGDQLEVDLEKGMVINKTTGETIEAEKISEYIMNIIASGGIKPLFKKITENMYK